MKSVHIRNIDESVLESLKRLARRHHRSLQGELQFILEKASRLETEESEDAVPDLITVRSGSAGTWTREEIYLDNGR